MLSKNQLKQLRNEIVLNSLYLKDYSNSLYIKNETVCTFFEGFLDFIYEEKSNGLNYYDILEKYDNIDTLYNYYLSIEGDPLLQDDIIASKAINNSDAVVIYDVNDRQVITSIMYLSGLYMACKKITKNKIYYGSNGDTYFMKYRQRYYLKDFIKCNF